MIIQPDFKELFALFNAHNVEYIIVGGYALAFYGAPRFTGDLDLFVKPTPENAQRILDALKEFGFGSVGLTRSDFEQPDQVIQLGVSPVRIDLITSLSGIGLDEAFEDRRTGQYGDIPVYFIGRKQLVANKRAVGRKRDEADLEALGEM